MNVALFFFGFGLGIFIVGLLTSSKIQDLETELFILKMNQNNQNDKGDI